tara:strand:- start:2593 stop:3972 length:1380 start_codon:yes stop_codon:yes gene_type:complete
METAKINVLSLFDGMSCGQITLDRLGVKVNKYYASEVDKYAMEIAKKNYPNTIHIGDVTKVDGTKLDKIDLMIGGSPCQGFSFAGKQLNFKDPRSALYFEFVRLLKETKPKYFLLENVRMKKEFQAIITKDLGVEPIMINSSLLSAQNRVRLYWTNIPNITQPEDKNILLKDILQYETENEYTEPYVKLNGKEKGCVGYVGNKPAQATRIYSTDDKSQSLMANGGGQGGKTGLYQIPSVDRDKSYCLDANYYKGANWKQYKTKSRRQLVMLGSVQVGTVNKGGQGDRIYSPEGKGISLTAQSGGTAGNGNMLIVGGAIRGRYEEDGSIKQQLEMRPDEKTNSLTTVQKDNVLVIAEATKKGYTEIKDGDCFDATFPSSKTRRGRNMKDKSNCLTAANYDYMRYEHPTYRKLTCVECERLQTVPDNYTEGVSNTQRYKMLGNGWTVDVIKHILGQAKWSN